MPAPPSPQSQIVSESSSVRVYYAATREDAARAGFDDVLIYDEIARPAAERRIPMLRLRCETEELPFAAWRSFAGRIEY